MKTNRKNGFGMVLALVLIVVVGMSTGQFDNKKTITETETAQTEAAQTEAVPAETEADTEVQTEAAEDQAEEQEEVTKIEIAVKDYGVIEAELYKDVAPITVENFISLVSDGFYDGLTFHRIIDGFMIQGGDPLGNGTGGSDNMIKGEFSANNVENDLSHERGVLSMARAQDPNSASSQFFIVQTDSKYLDGQYAAFGKVTSGMDIVDKICKDTPVTDGNGSVDKADQPVIEHISIIE